MRKKISLLVMSVVMMLTFSQSAFAVTGWYDTESTASPRPSGMQSFTFWFDSASDEDWYSYTNTTGSNQYVNANLNSSSYANRFRMDVKIVYDSLHSTSLFRATEAGSIHYLYNVQLPPGAKIYYKVSTENYSSSATYTLTTYQNP